jgi:CHAT domain-containing protein
VWWCVTGELTFLPIHAAGIYGGDDQDCASDYVVSSYVPSLSALAKARNQWSRVPCRDISGLLFGEPSSGHNRLVNVDREVYMVRACFEETSAQVLNPPSFHTSLADIQTYLSRGDSHILHLACHGDQAAKPLESAFLLQDGQLTLADIMRMNLPQAVLAFLSACWTAKGDEKAPDQAVHLAASMLFCGFRSVVGTMW